MGASLQSVVDQMVAAGLPPIGVDDIERNLDSQRWIRYGRGKKAFYKLFGHLTKSGERIVSHGTFGLGGDVFKVETEAGAGERLSADEWSALRRQVEARQREAARKAARAAHLAANRAIDQWQRAAVVGKSAYLDRKRVAKPEGVRFITSGAQAGWIIILLWRYDLGRVVGSQKIAPEALPDGGDKRFNKGFNPKGAAALLGDAPRDGDLILIGEGYATCATAREACRYRYPVYMALNAGNLGEVATLLRRLFPRSPILFLADDDYLPRKDGSDNDVGRIKAEEAARMARNARVVWPAFTVPRRQSRDDISLPKLTDFNDLHVAEGIEAVRHQLKQALQRRRPGSPTTSTRMPPRLSRQPLTRGDNTHASPVLPQV